MKKKDMERFEAKYTPEPNTGCWLWTGTVIDRKRKTHYGRFSLGNRCLAAHRVSYELYKKPIAEGMTLDHRCLQTLCVNPDHLEEVSRSENTTRSHISSPRPPGWWDKRGRKSEEVITCRLGHPYDSLAADGRRQCSACNSAPRPVRRTSHCKHGHLIAGDNAITSGQGGRVRCKTCNNTRYLAYYHRKRKALS